MVLLVAPGMVSCGQDTSGSGHGHDHGGHDHGAHAEEVRLSQLQFETMEMKLDTMKQQSIGAFVMANGELEIPPQNNALVTAVIGANVKKINVIEGDEVRKGEVLAYLSHPDLIRIQTAYLKSWNDLQYLEKEYARQKKLYDSKVGSGRDFQKVEAEYRSTKGEVSGYEAELNVLGINASKVRNGKISELVPVTSPISGHIKLVEVKTGQFVSPSQQMFEIVNLDDVHADLMVFEKDAHRVKKGQKVTFTVQSGPARTLEATIYSVGKAFEEEPKAIHVHAEIDNKDGLLLPGMYLNGKILVENVNGWILSEDAIVRQEEKYFIFTAKKDGERWVFQPIEVKVGETSNGLFEIKLLNELPKETLIAQNNAFYLMAELKKGEAEHSH